MPFSLMQQRDADNAPQTAKGVFRPLGNSPSERHCRHKPFGARCPTLLFSRYIV